MNSVVVACIVLAAGWLCLMAFNRWRFLMFEKRLGEHTPSKRGPVVWPGDNGHDGQ